MKIHSGFRLFLLSIVIIYAFNAGHLMAGENFWSSNGPYGGKVRTIAIDRVNPAHIFIGTAGIWQSSDAGDSWSWADGDSAYQPMISLSVHPLAPDTMLIGTVQGAFKTTNGGRSWVLLNIPEGAHDQYRAVKYYPINPSIAFIVTHHNYKTINGGQSWYPMPTPYTPAEGSAIAFDPTDEQGVYITTIDNHRLAVFHSDDLGESWENVTGDLDTASTVQDISVDPTDNRIIYVARLDFYRTNWRVVCKTTDGGAHWSDITPSGLRDPWILDVEVSPVDHNTIFIIASENGVLRSRDGGLTWQEINNGIYTRFGQCLAIDPEGILYYGTNNLGIYKSTDSGDTWQAINNGMNTSQCNDIAINWRNPDSVFVVTNGGLFFSADRTATWRHVVFNDSIVEEKSNCVRVDPYDPNIIYVAYCPEFGETGVYRSTDGGESWGFFNDGLANDNYYGTMEIANFGNGVRRIFLGSAYGGFFYSDDQALSWNLAADLPVSTYYISSDISPINPNIVYVGDFDNRLYKSFDGGNNWNQISSPTGGNKINQIVCDNIDENKIYICSEGIGIFRSIDGGESWEDINSNLPEVNNYRKVSGVVINPLNTDEIYANANGFNGIFVTYNGGASWENFSRGLRPYYNGSITIIDPQDTSQLYLATYNQSVWSYTKTVSSLNSEQLSLPNELSLSAYPNPFNSSTTISLSVPISTFISIYDISGRKVESLSLRDGKGVWDASPNSSGIYFARVENENKSSVIKLIYLK